MQIFEPILTILRPKKDNVFNHLHFGTVQSIQFDQIRKWGYDENEHMLTDFEHLKESWTLKLNQRVAYLNC